MARFPKTIGDVLSAHADANRSVRTEILSTPSLALLTSGNLADGAVDWDKLHPDVQAKNAELATVIEETKETLEAADAALAAAQLEADAAREELATALAASDQAQAQLVTDMGTLQNTTLPALSTDLGAARGRLDTAEGQLTDAFGQLGTVDVRIGDAQAGAIAAQAYSLNPSFDDWAGTSLPSLFSPFGVGAPIKETTLVRRGAFAARFNCTDATTDRGLNFNGILNHAPNLEYWTVELTFQLVSGASLAGAGVLLDWTGMTNNRAVLNLSAEIPAPVTGKWYTITKTLRRPTNAAGTWTVMDGYLMANYGSGLGGKTIKDVIFDWLDIRPATAEEITSYGAPGLIDAAMTMAGSKSKVYYSTAVATGTATADGDLWRQRDTSNNIIAEWRWNGTPPAGSWAKTMIGSDAVTNLDVGKLTAGAAVIDTAVAQKIAAGTAAFQQADIGNLTVTGTSKLADLVAQQVAADSGKYVSLAVSQLTAGTGSMAVGVIDKLYSDVVMSRKLIADQVILGSGANSFPDPRFTDPAGWASSQYITSGAGRGGGNGFVIPASTGQLGGYYGSTDRTRQFSVTAGQPYRISAWVKSTGIIPIGGAAVFAKWTTATSAVSGAFGTPGSVSNAVAIPANTWTQVEGIVTVGATAENMFIGLYKNAVANVPLTWSEPSVQPAVGTSLVATGAIIAPHITASEELTAKVAQFLKVRAEQIDVDYLWAQSSWTTKASAHLLEVLSNEDGTGYTSTVTGQGIKVTYTQKDASGNVVRVQPVVQLGTFGDDLISLYKNGIASFSANAEGDVAAKTVAATDEIYYRGDKLSELLYRLPRGHVSAAVRTTDQDFNSVSNNPEQPYLRLDVELEEGRLYKVWTSPIRIGVSAGQWGYARLHTQVNGVATITSPILNEIRLQPEGSSGVLQEIMTPTPANPVRGTKRQCSFLIGNITPAGGGESGIRATATNPVRLEVEDIGPLMSTGNGVWLVGANQAIPAPTPPPARVTYDKTYPNQDRRTFDGSGNQYTWPYPRGGQGQSPAGYGNLRSVWTFQNVLSDLSGATIHEVWAYFKFDQWYNNAGGTARIGLHGNLTLPATFNANSTVVATSGGWPAGADRWVKIPEAYYGGFANGTWRGFTLLGDSTTNTYGLASNSQLRIVYSKAG